MRDCHACSPSRFEIPTALIQESRSREFAELSWSVLLGPDGGVPPPSKLGNGELSMGERPAEQEDQVIYRMGFHVEWRELAGGMECIQVSSAACQPRRDWHCLKRLCALLFL